MLDMILAAKSNYKKKRLKNNIEDNERSSSKGQQHASPLLAIMIFLVAFAFIVGLITGNEILILNPIVIVSITGLFIVAIAAGNTPILRGVTIAAATTLLFSTFFIDFVGLGVPLQFLAFIILPFGIVFLFIFLEASKS